MIGYNCGSYGKVIDKPSNTIVHFYVNFECDRVVV